jgi:methyl-CpG-binding domain protein 4
MRERLIQEDYQDPWKMLICCILLNQTSNIQVRKVLIPLFEKIKNPEVCSKLSNDDIIHIIKSTGFSSMKSRRIIGLSKKWVEGFNDVRELPGVGSYAKDSWEIFVNGNFSINPTDKKLKMYLEQRENA